MKRTLRVIITFMPAKGPEEGFLLGEQLGIIGSQAGCLLTILQQDQVIASGQAGSNQTKACLGHLTWARLVSRKPKASIKQLEDAPVGSMGACVKANHRSTTA